MNEKLYEIEVQEIKFLGEIKYMSVGIPDFQVGSLAEPNMKVKFYNTNQAKVYELNVSMPREVYNQWGTDDSVIINYVCDILNLTLDE